MNIVILERSSVGDDVSVDLLNRFGEDEHGVVCLPESSRRPYSPDDIPAAFDPQALYALAFKEAGDQRTCYFAASEDSV